MDGCGLQLVLIDADGRRLAAGKTTFVKRHLTGEFEKKYERELDPGAHYIALQMLNSLAALVLLDDLLRILLWHAWS